MKRHSLEFLKRFNNVFNIFISWHSNPSNAGAKECGCFIPLQLQGPVDWILSRWCRWRCVWSSKMGGDPTISFPDSALDPWMGGGKLNDEPVLHEWKSEPRLVKQNKTKKNFVCESHLQSWRELWPRPGKCSNLKLQNWTQFVSHLGNKGSSIITLCFLYFFFCSRFAVWYFSSNANQS